MKKKYNDLRLKYNKLLLDNKELKQRIIDLKSKLTIREQHLISMNCAFDLSQKLTQHLKTENLLLRTAQELINPIESNINNNTIISDNQMNESIGNNNDRNDSNINNSVDNNLCESDLIANQYENEIKEWKEECDLLRNLDIDQVVVTAEDQLLANKYCKVSEDESDYEMDVHLQDNSKNSSIITRKPTETITKIKCEICAKKYSDESLLKEHKSRHKSDDNRIKCAEYNCRFKCDSRRTLKNHLKIHKNKIEAKVDETPKQDLNKNPLKIKLYSTPASKRLFECKECNKQLCSMQSLRQHQRAVHNMISWFKCKYSGCDEKFEKGTQLRLHEELHRKQSSQIAQQINQIIPIDSTPSYPTLPFDLNQNCTQTNSVTKVVSQYFTPINGNSSNTSDIYSTDVLPNSQQSVPKFKCKYNGCNFEVKLKKSLKKHEEKYHQNNSNSNVRKSDAQNDDKQIDMNQRLQLLNLLYAEQQKNVMM